ncbi:VCBS domain-containing protein [Devosia indica]|uniref:VCBS domain-containing protein n=1 Tax=Devosia indica TaxID=2079253 RepID=UPI000D391348|nr:VCBS domain-containing protein [Devosia indica]
MALVLKGSSNDIIQTGSASDLIFAGSGNDVVSSGGGNDTVYLGSGNDTAIFVWEENRNNTNTFRGESGTDTLRIELTASEAADPDVLRDIAAFEAHLASGSNASFFFSSIRLTVSDFERLEIVAPVVAADDAAEVSEDGPAVVINVLDNDQDLLAADNSALQIVGYDASDIPSGATLVLNSDQTFSFEPGTAFDWLANGQQTTVTFTYLVEDNQGFEALGTVNLTITGSNDAPVITSQAQSGAITEIADGATGENSASHSASGAVSFADADLSDSHSAGFAAQGSGYLGSFSLDPLDQGSDSVGWSFSVDDAALDHLAAGEVLTQSYEITIDDGEGGTASQIVEVTITGSNDAPVITSQAQSGAITEIADGATGENSASHSASGTVSFADADLSDSHSAGFAAQGSGYLGSFSLDPLDQGSDSVGWSFSVDDAALDHLAAGEVLTQSYEITIDDGEGGTASQIVEVTITGSNDGPTLSAGLAVATEDGPAVVVDLSALGDDVDSDDDGTSLGYTILTQPAEGSASISGTTLTFAPGAAFQDLADGETRDVTIEVQASDAHGASATSLVTVTLTGTNDTPANLSLSGTQAPENVPSAVVGILSADDPDTGDSLTYSILPGGDSNAFVIVGNELRVGATALDYETKPTYSLTIRATDQYGAHVDHVFQLEVVDSDEQTLTTGTDVITPGAGNTQVLGNAQTLNANDNLDGGGGIDELVLYGSGTFDLNSLAGFANFEGIRLVNLNSSSSTTLTLKNGISSNVTTSGLGTNTINVNGSTTVNAINGGDGREIIRLADSAHVAEINLGNGSSQQVYLFNAASTGTINGGSSTDSIYLQGQGTVDAVNLGAGSDTVYVFSSAAWNPALSMDGGLGNDELYFSAGVGTFDLRSASLENVEWLTVFNAELIVDDDVLAGVNLLRGGVGSSFRTDDATLDLTGISVQNAQVTSNNAAGTTFAVNSKPTAFQVYGGGGFDTIETATFAFTTDERAFIFNSSSIEQIIDTSGVYHAPPLPPETYKLTVGSDTLALGATNDTVNANAQTLNSTDNLDAGAGDDILALYGSGSFNLNSLAAFAGFETVRYSSDSSSNQIYLRNGTTVDVETSGIGSKTIYTGATAAIGSFTGSDGSESVWLDGTGSIDSFIGGASSDVLYVRTTSSWNDNLSMDGGTGSDTLYFYFASGTFDLRGATLQSVETIRAIGTVTLLVDDATLSDVSAILGSSALAIQTDASSLDLSGITVQNAQVTSANASGTVFTINSKPTAFQVFGGAGQDAITTSAFAFTSDEREIIFASSSVEQITDASGTYNAPPPAANTYVLTTSADTLALGGTDDTVNANAQTLNSTDDLDAGAGNDVLALYGNGSYNLNGLTGFANFEEVRVTTVSGSNSSLYLRNGTTSDVTHTGDGTLTLYVQGTAAIDQFIGGTSSAYLYFYDSSSFSSLDMGSASNSITVQDATAWNPNSSINGGASVDRLYFSAANTTFDVRNASLDSVEQIYANGTNSVVVVDTDALDDVSVLSGGTTGRFRFEETEVDLSGISISNVRVESGAVSGTSFAVNSKQAAYQIQGGIGQDAVKTASFAFTATERDFIFNASSIEVIQDTTGIYGNGVSNSLQAEAGGSIMSAGGGDDELISGAGNDTMTGGAGADQFVFAQNSGNDTITDFELGVDGLVLEAGVTIASLTETNTGGSSSLDTVVELSTGDTVVLLDVSNITDPNNLVV